ncbi:alpha/beta hydrolase [Kordiimonas sp.]|uniref:alpha/beta hydrolase n=1 Tax=Kordiimonas sp. TaxID=1970157 RepID=UPI003A8D4F8F
MKTSRRSILMGSLAALLAPVAVRAQTAPPALAGSELPPGLPQPDETIDLWPDGLPGGENPALTETVIERSRDRLVTDRAVYGITNPRMAVFRPRKPNGAAIMITPGGGYKWVVVDKEGYEVGRRLSALGYTVFVLFYRLPNEGWQDGANVPLADAQRAMRLIRARAQDYGVDPERVAAMGFSAGGHLCADLGTRFDAGVYEPLDAADQLSARPFLAAPIYPVISMTAPNAHPGSRALLVGEDADPKREAAHSPDRNMPEGAPPFFILHAEDDPVVPVENAVLLRAALKAKGIPVETHLFAHGGHGFGLRKAVGKPVEGWLDLFLAWAQAVGFANRY